MGTQPTTPASTGAATVAALGVVFGDLGTSPLYALQEAFTGRHGVASTPENVLGVVSLFIWSLLGVVSIKYVLFIMRADNRGEGGILALLALTGARGKSDFRARGLLVLGLFGATLLYGDGIITPAVSVLSAIEGLEIASTRFTPFVIPLTVLILVGLSSFSDSAAGVWAASSARCCCSGSPRSPPSACARSSRHRARSRPCRPCTRCVTSASTA
jgi:KUP system potassium uptake protein